MKSLPIFATAARLLSAIYVGTITLQKPTGDSARVIGLPIQRAVVPDPVARDRLRRRAKSVDVSLDNHELLYVTNISLGTPPQPLLLQVDTGSSDLWVNNPQSILCEGSKTCSESGTYTANSSSSYSYISSGFNVSYADGLGASGDYVSDTLNIGGVRLENLQFGLGYQSSSQIGILGIGYQHNEVQVKWLGQGAYENVPAKMLADGLIASNAYSLYMNDLDSSTGSILFGGVDTEQFEGTLATLPINQENGLYTEFLITLTALSIDGTAIASNQRISVLLDSGASLTYLPDSIVSAIYQSIGAQYDSSQNVANVPCGLATSNSTLDFTFSSATIKVSMDELVIPSLNSNGSPEILPDGSRFCFLGIVPTGSGIPTLGDTFLRSAYVVYDLTNNEISLAQSVFNATTSNVLEIGTGVNAVPSATAVQNATIVEGGLGPSKGTTAVPTSSVAIATSSVTIAASSVAIAASVETALPLGAAAAAAAAIIFAAM